MPALGEPGSVAAADEGGDRRVVGVLGVGEGLVVGPGHLARVDEVALGDRRGELAVDDDGHARDVEDLHRDEALGVGLAGDGDDVAGLEALGGGDRELGLAGDRGDRGGEAPGAAAEGVLEQAALPGWGELFAVGGRGLGAVEIGLEGPPSAVLSPWRGWASA